MTRDEFEAVLRELHVSWKAGEAPDVLWLTLDGAAYRFSFGCQFNAQTFRLYYRFTETPADLSREMLVYYLQLNDDFTQFQLFLDPSNRLYLGFEMPAAVLTAPFLKWVLNDYTSYCDQLYEDLSTAT